MGPSPGGISGPRGHRGADSVWLEGTATEESTTCFLLYMLRHRSQLGKTMLKCQENGSLKGFPMVCRKMELKDMLMLVKKKV